LNLEAKLDQQTFPVYRRSQKVVDLKGKSRSYSSPLPLSALDIVPSATTNVFTPIPIIPRNYFDEALPRELRLRILSSLLSLHEEEHDRIVREGYWTVMRASSSKNKWVGRNKGIRELVKFRRVSNASTNFVNKVLIVLVGFKVMAGPRLRRSDVEQSEPSCLSKHITISFNPFV